MKKIIPLFILVLSFVLAIIAIPYMPLLMASHWGIGGEVDGYMPRMTALFLMPFISLAMYILFLFLPKLEPYQENFKQFEGHYDNFMIVIFSFMFYMYLLTLAWNYGLVFNLIQLMSPGLSVLFFYTASLLENTKMNWFVGIRTPWTMSDPTVWKKTHKLGASLFKIVSLLTLTGMIFPSVTFYTFFIPLIFSVVIIYFYSYWQYRKINRGLHSHH
ncbi:SdpI family protein [Candidatus Shapirobacteria bacterium]|nr:SdpI family protein [Candidatus Shapirobacteria bacterium]